MIDDIGPQKPGKHAPAAWWLRRTILRTMAVLAAVAVVLAGARSWRRPAPSTRPPVTFVLRPPRLDGLRVASLDEGIVHAAPTAIDPRFTIAAREGIDDGILVAPDHLRGRGRPAPPVIAPGGLPPGPPSFRLTPSVPSRPSPPPSPLRLRR